MDEIEVKVKKASRFVDNFIKVITVLSFLLFSVSFYIYHNKSGILYKNQMLLCDAVWSQGMTEENPLKNPIHETFLDYRNACFNNAGKTSEMWGKTAFIALDITILLPIVYFGGKKMVKDTTDKMIKVQQLS